MSDAFATVVRTTVHATPRSVHMDRDLMARGLDAAIEMAEKGWSEGDSIDRC